MTATKQRGWNGTTLGAQQRRVVELLGQHPDGLPLPAVASRLAIDRRQLRPMVRRLTDTGWLRASQDDGGRLIAVRAPDGRPALATTAAE